MAKVPASNVVMQSEILSTGIKAQAERQINI
jgi:hypothetical protein